jgi:hypothetical protein
MTEAKVQKVELLDLSQFSSVDDAIKKIEIGDRYTHVFVEIVSQPMDMDERFLFFSSIISRSVGLHAAIVREVRESNPHAVLPLLRALAEDVLLLMYVIDNPKYVKAVSERAKDLPRNGPKRKSIQALISHSASVAPGFKLVYSELSEGTHFGAIAMWMSHSTSKSDVPGVAAKWKWSSAPHWRSDNDALTACAQLLELADCMEVFLRRFAVRFILPLTKPEK